VEKLKRERDFTIGQLNRIQGSMEQNGTDNDHLKSQYKKTVGELEQVTASYNEAVEDNKDLRKRIRYLESHVRNINRINSSEKKKSRNGNKSQDPHQRFSNLIEEYRNESKKCESRINELQKKLSHTSFK